MASLTYKVDGCVQSDWHTGTTSPGVLACLNTPITHPGQSSAFTYTASAESKTLTPGDRVHARPFVGVYTEVQPMTGTFRVDTRRFQNTSPSDVIYCGTRAGSAMLYTGDVGFYVKSPTTAPAPADDPLLRRALKQQADTKALADLRRSMFNAPLIIGERKETVDMLRRKGLQIAAAVKHRQTTDLSRWLSTRKADKRRVAKDIAGEHLAFLFGFLPLIDEIEGICGALASDTPTKITGRGRAAKVVDSMKNTTNGIDIYSAMVFPNALAGIKTTKTVRFSHRTSISALVTMSGAQYARDAGFNPLATVYDLVPLSFLSDFVSNLGTFIRSLDPLIGVEFLTGSSTSWVENRTDVRVNGYSMSRTFSKDLAFTTSTTGAGHGYARYLKVDRQVLTSYPDPSLMWVNNMSLAKVGTIASLAIQRYLKPVQRLFNVKTFRYKGKRPRYLPPIKYR